MPFYNFNSTRPQTGRYQEWLKPFAWRDTPLEPLYFEIFQFCNSGNWKVSLIAEVTDNPTRLSELRKSLEFLEKEFHWVLPQNNFNELSNEERRITAAVYLKNFGQQTSEDIAIALAKKKILATLNHKDWENALGIQ